MTTRLNEASLIALGIDRATVAALRQTKQDADEAATMTEVQSYVAGLGYSTILYVNTEIVEALDYVAATYAPLTGAGTSGTWGISISGNAATATNASQLGGAAASTYAPKDSPAFTTAVGFNGTAAITKPTVTGSRGGNAALASLLTAFASYGLITDSTTA